MAKTNIIIGVYLQNFWCRDEVWGPAGSFDLKFFKRILWKRQQDKIRRKKEK